MTIDRIRIGPATQELGNETAGSPPVLAFAPARESTL